MSSAGQRIAGYLMLFVVFCSVLGKHHRGQKSGNHNDENAQPSQMSDDVNIDTDEMDQCLPDFQVEQNTIIRTYDSREAGAEFLTSPDCRTAQDCMLRCCGTDRCNLAVFEDKVCI